VNAGGALAEFRQVLHLVHRLIRLDNGRVRGIHVVGIGGHQFAAAVRGVAVFHAEILNAQPPDGRDHPTVLVAMIVNAAEVPDFPADGHHFEELAFVNQVSGVVALGVEKVGLERFRADGLCLRELQNARDGELLLRNAAELFHPVIDGQLFHARGRFHCCPRSLRENRSNASIISPRARRGGEKSSHSRRAMMDGKMSQQTSTARVNLLGKSSDELRAYAESLGEPAYRGAQIYHALYAERRFELAAMTNLPAALRERLEREAAIALPQIVRRYRSGDGTVRYVLALGVEKTGEVAATKPATIEAVFMPEENRQTICISTQAGCAVDCHFCLTATLGLIRNLTSGEIIGQVLVALDDNRATLKPLTNVVLMGQGEPLLNYDAVLAALRILLDPNGMAISPKHVTLSTSGIVPGIERLAQEKIRPKLAISLNASSNEQRDRIMPINRKYPIEKLLDACRRYPLRPWEHLTFEYVLLGGFNDSAEDARRVMRLLANLRCKVNLIPWNPGELPYEKPDPERVEQFRKILADKDMRVFVRYSRGQDVMAACGQLALLESAAPPSAFALISPSA